MHEELAAVLALMPDEHKEVVAGREFWRRPPARPGSRGGAVAHRQGCGRDHGAVLIERFGVQRIVFTGVAGGLGPGVKVGDIVVADGFLQHDLDASPIFPKYEVPLYGLQPLHGRPSGYRPELAAAAQAALPGVTLHRGLVISGDRFVATTAESRALQSALPEALAVEMEGAAIAQVCHDYGLPFAAVRTISDRADDAAHVDFTRFIQEVASRYSAAIVAALLSPTSASRAS